MNSSFIQVPYYWAPLFGLLAVLPTYYAVGKGLNTFMFDPLGIFSIHAIPGFVGMLLTGFLAR
jgi:ammonia channel protein AmtB